MFYKSEPKSYIMTPRRRQICRPLARGSRSTFARKCLSDRKVRNAIVKNLGVSLQKEVAQLCSEDGGSIINDKSTSAVKDFTWDRFLSEVQMLAPTLYNLLQSCCKTRKSRKNHNAIIASRRGVWRARLAITYQNTLLCFGVKLPSFILRNVCKSLAPKNAKMRN